MKYKLSYGKTYINLTLPSDSQFIKINPPGSKPDKTIFIKQLSGLIKPGASSAGIVVSDKTRVCEYDKYLPWLIETLKKKGFDESSIRFYIAYGTHPVQSREESLMIYGDLYDSYKFVHHDCDDLRAMTNLGTTGRGTQVQIRKDVLEHELLILFGALTHHYFAGYGGGRKLLFPGLAERQSVYANHKMYIDFDKYMLRPGCRSGNLSGNAVAEDLREIDGLMPEKIIISGIPGTKGRIGRLLIDKTYEDFVSSCSIYDNHFRKGESNKYDNVIAGTGGYPKDINFIQAHKSLHNAASFVKDGGNLYLLAECRDGTGNDEFIKILKGKNKKEIFDDLRENYSGNGGTALSLLSKTERINIHMLTGLDDKICNILNINKITADDLGKKSGRLSGSTALIENASMVYC
ncbi:MAG: lactate racemase domain-containing protein [Bacteroidales bacterium]|nr:lactate racemase domain-containing protein [Bacteroidales bacterium]